MGNSIVRYTLSPDSSDLHRSSDNLDYSESNSFSELTFVIESYESEFKKILDVPELGGSKALRSIAELEAYMRSVDHLVLSSSLPESKSYSLFASKLRGSTHDASIKSVNQARHWFSSCLALFRKKSDTLIIGHGNFVHENYHLSNDLSAGNFNYELHELEDAVYSGQLCDEKSVNDDDSSFAADLPAWPKDKRNEPYEI